MNSFFQTVYDRLFTAYGPQNWWPADSPFEVIVGAILTQNTAWTNVERAISNLRSAGALELETLHRLPHTALETMIRPAGFFRQKARRLQLFTAFVSDQHNGNLDQLLALPLEPLRTLLLARAGIGPETADAILLYAAAQPSFVIDAYTIRLLERLDRLPSNATYLQLRALFTAHLPLSAPLFNEYHALIIRHVKSCCRKKYPRCGICPLLDLCPAGQRTPLMTG